MNSQILNTALSQYGIKEIKGSKDNPEILKYFNSIGFDGSALKDETAWCAAFANWVCKTSGVEYSGKLNARSFIKIGQEVSTPEIGDLVILWRQSPSSWKGHVGFFIRETKEHIYVLGGNQSNQVCIAPYPKKRLLAYKRLKTI